MKQAPIDPERDARRIAEINRYRLPDFAGRRELTGLADLAARLCGATHAMISFIDETHLRMLATTGFDGFDVPRAQSICNTVLYDDGPFLATDLLADEAFDDSLAATSGLARFYATEQLVLPGSGEPIGSLCVFDPAPRDLDDGQRQALHDLADRVVDVLELDMRTRMLSRTVAELERSNMQLSAFAAQISHDLSNPLAAVAGQLELVEELVEVPDPDLGTVRSVVDRARNSTQRMTVLVQGVLAHATLDGSMSPERIDVAQLVAAVRDDLAVDATDADVQLGPLADVTADPVCLRVVVQNLVSNALKYAGDAAPSVQIEAVVEARPSPTWRLRVADHGTGIDPADRERVFDPLVRINRDVPGTGIGLATCRRVMESHGGRVWLDETPGGGTTAWVELPAEVE